MTSWRKATRGLWFALTIFLSAFLVFQVQPVISKTILPWFGGTPAVWTTCVLFFQVVLFLGYLYAHVLTRYLSAEFQGWVHMMLLALALLFVPISPSDAWKPGNDHAPTWTILWMLLANVGLPYFLLSTTAPLLQAWFSRTCQGQSPYRLYALSNIGSLLALLSYPFLFEPTLTIMHQDWLWSAGFCGFVLACAYLALQIRKSNSPAQETLAANPTSPKTWNLIRWLAFPAFASCTFLSTTNHVCQDVAVVPFLWILPLSLYLITFIVCFDNESWYSRRWMSFGVIAGVVLLNILVVDDWLAEQLQELGVNSRIQDITENLFLTTGAHLATMFFVCMLCHGELVRSKPSADHLTTFYLSTGAGGALGGILVGIVCPLIFETHFETNLIWMAGIIVAFWIFWRDAANSYLSQRIGWQNVLRVTAITVGFLVVKIQLASDVHGSIATIRNFYGVLRVDQVQGPDQNPIARNLIHGSTIHGSQFTEREKSRRPTSYYSFTSGVGRAIHHQQGRGAMRMGVVGLGAGTLATYGRDGDYLRFYEINPAVVEIAQRHFTYLSSSPSKIDIVLGDARLSLEREESQQFDVLVLDAFSSDAIPVHLLTCQAFTTYLRHLAPQGMMAVHTSNRHLNLLPVVAKLGQNFGLHHGWIFDREDAANRCSASQWVLLARDQRSLREENIAPQLKQVGQELVYAPLWTDQFNNLFDIMRL